METLSCARHHWRYEEHEPELLRQLEMRYCPLCLMEEDASKSEGGAIKYSSAIVRHQEKLSPDEVREMDLEIVARWIQSLHQYI